MRTNLLSAIVISLIVGGVLGGLITKQKGTSEKHLELTTAMRRLWEDHITWTRSYLVSAAVDAPNTNNDATRLLKNQEDIGNAIKPYYGEENGNKLTALLRDHILIATDVVKAAKAGDKPSLDLANSKWYDNANQIADFLSSANSNLPQDDTRKMMKEHLDLTEQEAVDILSKNYDKSIADYDQVKSEILTMSDAISNGIVKQFPDKF